MTELALAIEFAGLTGLTPSVIVGFHNEVSEQLPKFSDQLPIASQALPGPAAAGSLVGGAGAFGFLQSDAPLLRGWMLSDDEDMLLQLQFDRLVLNWRKSDGNQYPSYDLLVDQFQRYWHKFSKYLRDSRLPAARPLVAEVVFVNILGTTLTSGNFAEWVSLATPTTALSDLISTGVEYIAGVRGVSGGQGQCSIRAWSDVRQQDSANITITTRIALPSSDSEFGSFEADMRRAHDASVRAFRISTTQAAHAQWGWRPA